MLKYDGFHKIEQLEIMMKGRKRIIEKVGIKSAVAALVLDANDKIGIVQQFRPCVNKITYEIPAGLMDKEGKDDIQVLIEELEEECNISVDEINFFLTEPIAEYYTVIGSSDAVMRIYFVKLHTSQRNKLINDAEVDKVIWLNIDELDSLMNDTKIKDSKTLMAYNWLSDRIKEN